MRAGHPGGHRGQALCALRQRRGAAAALLLRPGPPGIPGELHPYKIIKHQDLPFITCTPDGELEETATGRLGGLEIKTTEILSSTGWTHWKGRIPTEYYAQVCQQMLAAGWQFVELLAQIKYTTAEGEDRKETRHYKIERADAEDDIAIIRREAVPFWRCVEQRQKPNLKLPPI